MSDSSKKFENYEVTEEIDHGAFGTVYRAWDRKLGREVSVKLLEKGLLKRSEAEQNFERETKIATRLHHPNIVGILDFGESENYRYIIMESVPGKSLRELLKQKKQFSIEEALPLLKQVARAIDYIHGNKVIHRDLKPDNIIVQADGDVKIVDFGLARQISTDKDTLALNVSEQKSRIITTLESIGTPAYLAPELISRGAHTSTRAVDIYALGVMVYEMLTGQLPFEMDNPIAALHAAVYDRPTDPSSINKQLNPYVADVLLRAVSKNPVERYSDATSFVIALEDASKRTDSYSDKRKSFHILQGEAIQIRFNYQQENFLSSLELTPEILKSFINPYLEAISNIQSIFDEISGKPPSHIRIRSITQNSPISASVEGIANAASIVQEMIVPWRRLHAKFMAELLEQEKQIVIERTKGEVLEIHARASRERAEKEKLLSEAALQNVQVEKLRLENEATRLKLQREKIQLVISILEQISSSLPEDVKVSYIVKLLPSLDTIITSPLEISLMDK